MEIVVDFDNSFREVREKRFDGMDLEKNGR